VNADSLRMVPEVQAFLRAMQDAGKPLSAICHAPWELVSAGLVHGISYGDPGRVPQNSEGGQPVQRCGTQAANPRPAERQPNLRIFQ
jgi:hypothetical protein